MANEPKNKIPTYEELAQRVEELEQEKLERKLMKVGVAKGEDWPTYKMESEINPEINMLAYDLEAIINVEEIQSIMDDFHHLTHMATALLDMNGKVLEATGWQDICTKFHRINPKTARNCTESDLFLAKNLKPGEYIDYKCKNGLWDVVTPLYIGTRHLGNIFTGQFFYDDDPIDEEFFMKQAYLYGFEKDSYMDAYRRIPRYSRETVKHLVNFLVKFTTYVSRIGVLNLQLQKEIHDRLKADDKIRELNRNLELRVHQRTTELEETNKELEDFVYSISHDLRAPLRSISGFAQIIDRRHKASLNEEGHHYFDNIIKASSQMGDLIDDLLKFSRLGRKAIKPEDVSLDGVFKAAIETLSNQMKMAGAQVNLPEQMPTIQGDLTLATHVFINLLENAVKYHRPNEPPQIDVGVEIEDRYAIVSIADNGLGIASEYHEKIFAIFQRLHSQAEYPGTGIGLAAVKKAMQIMGGQVAVASEPGKGSVFRVKFLKGIPSFERT